MSPFAQAHTSRGLPGSLLRRRYDASRRRRCDGANNVSRKNTASCQATAFHGDRRFGEPSEVPTGGASTCIEPQCSVPKGQLCARAGEYARVVSLLEPLVVPEIQLEDPEQIFRSYKLLGEAYLYEGKRDQAADAFLKMLELRPSYRLGLELDPPEIVAFFNQIRRENQASLAEIEAHRRNAAALAAPRPTPVVHLRHNSLAVAFLPFGAGQFQNDQNRKAWAFLTLESALAGVSVGAFLWNRAVYGDRQQVQCSESTAYPPFSPRALGPCPGGRIDRGPQERSRRLTQIQVGTGAVFFAVALWGVLDALWYHTPTRPIDPPTKGSSPKPRKSPKLGLAPLGPVLDLRF